jgi:AAA15 family ATPase/GTPase
MSEHFIKNIEIKDFKCFKDFKAEGFGRVNLIGGKNNVGKTAFIEACFINLEEVSQALIDTITYRYQSYILDRLLKKVGPEYILDFIMNKANEISGGKIISNIYTQDVKYTKSDILKNRLNKITYIPASQQSYKQYEEWYSTIIENDLEALVDSYIKKFDQDIEKFRIIKSMPMCQKIDNKQFYNLNDFGDGLAKFLSYLLLLLASRNCIIVVDEIENGIHYSKLDRLWEIILTISKKQNVQVFATTHSKECIESYARVAKRLEDEEITYTILSKLDDGFIDAGIYDSSMLINTIEQDHEVRGW